MDNTTTYRFTVTYESIVDTTTGEILETKILSKSDAPKKVVRKVKKDEDVIPKITLEANKYSINSAAIELMGVHPDDKLDIRYETKDGVSCPIILIDEHGNRLTKSNTVALRGAKREALVNYGTEFEVVKHPIDEGVFILKSNNGEVVNANGDENVNIEKEDDIPFDLNLDDLVDEKDTNTVIDSNFFKL